MTLLGQRRNGDTRETLKVEEGGEKYAGERIPEHRESSRGNDQQQGQPGGHGDRWEGRWGASIYCSIVSRGQAQANG